jgi:hypothetical protein
MSAQEFMRWLAWYEIKEDKSRAADKQRGDMESWFQLEG